MDTDDRHGNQALFLDQVSQRNSRLAAIDPRIKALFAGSMIVFHLFIRVVWVPMLMAALAVGLLVFEHRVQISILFKRLLPPLIIAAMVLVLRTLTYGTTPLYQIPLPFGYHLTLWGEGLADGWLIFWRITGGIALIFWLTMTTSFHRLLSTARWFRVPNVVLAVTTFAYRYIFVFYEETKRMRSAQKMRLGYTGAAKTRKSLSMLFGSLLIRSFDRADVIYDAMRSRGYSGIYPVRPLPPWDRQMTRQAVAAGTLILALTIVMVG